MTSKGKLVSAVLIILFLFTACSTEMEASDSSLIVTGDVDYEYILQYSEESELDWQTLEKDDNEYRSIKLNEIFNLYGYKESDFSVLIVAGDGMKVKIDTSYGKVNVYDNKGWNIYAPDFPPTVNLKDIVEIVLIKNDYDLSESVNIISAKENLASFTPGNMHLMNLQLYNFFDGESVKNDEFSMKAYKEKYLLPVEEAAGEEFRSSIVMSRSGEYYFTADKGYLQLQGNIINYTEPENRKTIFDIVGVVINPPAGSVMDSYYDTKHYLDKDEDVLHIFIDGFSSSQYEYAKENGYIPYIAGLGHMETALTIFKPVTNSGYAAMITGQPPAVNGILNRDYREVKVDTIFDYVSALGKTSAIIEGNANIITTHGNPILNTDVNGNGFTDDEVFESALENIYGSDYAFVHFHGVDDSGHDNGDISEETMDKISEVDGYVKKLVENWSGKVIITADHGMHSTDDGGCHGEFRYEDMVIPYILAEGGF
ncbi:Type I phosphodiesterase / nucleotide pyrophosphatase [Dethiosulfatibacter aminovorans DSM 17477]|uniref:Type I phosphodiesterase / nucleotide pyrophosphatase n=1 Tax=Dethiosulfatibacter aminovorans DSM 17477 TaxID=1121476 RepID=A0A1M6HHY7_9FIRM|nr:alkaline phosphatase family protein [Dethiosulfatibacter aminovorans]SHJ21827.1 Type I phosphodiesterase / nucleotide pyrophosphatase [Dethiosulfatibacter aminovorans DSM 17477]